MEGAAESFQYLPAYAPELEDAISSRVQIFALRSRENPRKDGGFRHSFTREAQSSVAGRSAWCGTRS